MLPAFLVIAIVGSMLMGVGAASVFSESAEVVPFMPRPETGMVLAVIGVCLTVVGLTGLRFARRREAPVSVSSSSPRLPAQLRSIEWFTLAMSIALVGYGLAGLLPDSLAILANPKPWWLHSLIVAAGTAAAWRSASHLKIGNQSDQRSGKDAV